LLLLIFPIQIGSAQTQTDDWLTLENDYFILNYKAGHLADAQLILGYCNYARDVVMSIYPHNIGMKVTVYLNDSQHWGNSIYTSLSTVGDGIASMFFLTPSDVPQSARWWVDNLFYQHAVVHEYVHCATYTDLQKVAYYRSGECPDWLTQGIAEYISISCTTPEIYQKEMNGHNYPELISEFASGSLFFPLGDVYFMGYYIMKYVYETYGNDRVHLLFNTNVASFWDAVNQSLGVSINDFEKNWIKWLYHEVNQPIPARYLENDQLIAQYTDLEKNYTALSGDYENLSMQYQQLNATYCQLQTSFASTQATNSALQLNYSQLQSNYNTLKAADELLQSNYSQLQSIYNTLKTADELLHSQYTDLKNAKDSLSAAYDGLQLRFDNLQVEKNNLSANSDTLQLQYSDLQTDYNELQTNASMIQTERDSLNATNEKLSSDYQGLQNKYNELNGEYALLEGTFKSLNASYFELQTNYHGEAKPVNNDFPTGTYLIAILLCTTLVFMTTTVYLALRKRTAG